MLSKFKEKEMYQTAYFMHDTSISDAESIWTTLYNFMLFKICET